MIRIQRAPDPPPALVAAAASRLPELARKVANHEKLLDADFEGYSEAKDPLFRAQHHKCCFCEQKCSKDNNDVEHFRPKRKANRIPGSRDRTGYWWLAFDWENLLFSCRQCNTKKGFKFPLAQGSGLLSPHVAAASQSAIEWPHLIHPAREQGISHIEFRKEMSGGRALWRPRPRNQSLRGAVTIRVLQLDREDLIEAYDFHVRRHVEPAVEPVREALARGDREILWRSFHKAKRNLFASEMPFLGLTHDVVRDLVPGGDLARMDRRLSWPGPDEIPLPPRGLR